MYFDYLCANVVVISGQIKQELQFEKITKVGQCSYKISVEVLRAKLELLRVLLKVCEFYW
jgi:hypothetical protein